MTSSRAGLAPSRGRARADRLGGRGRAGGDVEVGQAAGQPGPAREVPAQQQPQAEPEAAPGDQCDGHLATSGSGSVAGSDSRSRSGGRSRCMACIHR